MTLLDVSTVMRMGPGSSLGLTPLLLASLALGLGVLLLMLVLKRREAENASKDPLPDGPWGLPIVGHLPFFGTTPHIKFANWAKVYGPVFRIRMGTWPAVVINGHAAIREALVGQGAKMAGRPKFFSFSHVGGGTTITFNSYSRTWRDHKALGRAAFALFTKKKTDELEAHVIDEADTAIREMVAGGKPVDPWESIHAAASAIVFSICFEEGRGIREDADFLKCIQALEAANVALDPKSNLIDLIPWAAPFLNSKIRLIKSLFDDFQRNVIATQKRVLLTRTPGHPRNLTDALQDAIETEECGRSLTEDQILAVATDVMGAGQGTIVIFLCWTLLYLIEFPELQEAANAEIDQNLGSEKSPRFSDRSRLPLCEAICLETFRMSPALPFLIPHTALEECSVMGRRIPKGTIILANMLTDSRDPELWEEPDRFNPYRFIDATGKINRTLSEHIGAFGMGKRRCMGEFLGRLETFVFIVRMLQRWRFSKDPSQSYTMEPDIRFTWEPKRYKLLIEPRHASS